MKAWTLALITLSLTSVGQAVLHCDDHFNIYVPGQRILDTDFALPKNGVLKATDRMAIQDILADVSRSPEERWRAVNRKYLQARLQTIPLRHRHKLLEILSQLQPTFKLSSKMIANSGQVQLSTVLRDTPIPSLILAHELEHVIQFYARNPTQSLALSLLANNFYRFDPHTIFRFEAEALAAEWEIYAATSDAVMDAAVERISKSYVDSKELFLIILRNRNMSRDEYVQHQHKLGRYSMAQATQMTQFNVMQIFFPGMFGPRR